MRIFLVTALLALTACQAQRTLIVTSEPTGAFVRVDGVAYGTTPAKIPFLHYGTRRVSLDLDGYLSHSEVIRLQPPWYGYFPLDFLTEILIPVGWRDRHKVGAVLQVGDGKIAPPDLEDVLRRAEDLRRAGPAGPKSSPREAEGAAQSEPPATQAPETR